MICPNCKETVQENQKFCPNCGYQLEYPKTREQMRHNQPTKEAGNPFLNYAKNNYLLLTGLIVIDAILFFWKILFGFIDLVLILMFYYLRATAKNGAKEKIEEKLQSNVKRKESTKEGKPKKRFTNIGNVAILIVSSLITLASDFFGNFIQIDAGVANFNTSTPMSLYDALNLGGAAAKITNALGVQIDIQGILLVVFYGLVAIPLLVILLIFVGGRLVRFVLSTIACSAYVGSLIYVFYETQQLQQQGITLGLTPKIMFFVAMISSFVMLIYSVRVKRV